MAGVVLMLRDQREKEGESEGLLDFVATDSEGEEYYPLAWGGGAGLCRKPGQHAQPIAGDASSGVRPGARGLGRGPLLTAAQGGPRWPPFLPPPLLAPVGLCRRVATAPGGADAARPASARPASAAATPRGAFPLGELGSRCPALLRRVLVTAGATDIGRYWRWSVVQEGRAEITRDDKDRRMWLWSCLPEEGRAQFAEAFREAFGETGALFGLLVERSPPDLGVWGAQRSQGSLANAAITHSALLGPSAPQGGGSAASAATLPFSPGDHVLISGLLSERGGQLNGLRATVVRYVEERSRFEVQLSQEELLVSLKPENMRKCFSWVPCLQRPRRALGYVAQGPGPMDGLADSADVSAET